jgi:hypothetical protein
MITFYFLRFDTPQTWRARSLYLYPLGNRVTQLYPQALGSLFVPSYYSHGYGQDIRPRHTLKVKVMLRPTVSRPASLSWNKAPIWGLRPYLCYCQTVAGFLMWGAPPDERTGLSLPESQSAVTGLFVSMYNLHFKSY